MRINSVLTTTLILYYNMVQHRYKEQGKQVVTKCLNNYLKSYLKNYCMNSDHYIKNVKEKLWLLTP